MEGFSVREYARAQGVTITGVYRRVWEGRLPAIKVDGVWRILGTKSTSTQEHESQDRADDRRVAGGLRS